MNSPESFINANSEAIAGWSEHVLKIDDAVGMALQIIRDHAFQDREMGACLPMVKWPQPEERQDAPFKVCPVLLDRTGSYAQIKGHATKLVFDIDCIGIPGQRMPLFTIDWGGKMRQVTSYDSSFLSLQQIGQVIADLKTYDQLIRDGQGLY